MNTGRYNKSCEKLYDEPIPVTPLEASKLETGSNMRARYNGRIIMIHN